MTERTYSFEFFPPKTAEGADKLDYLRIDLYRVLVLNTLRRA